MQFFPTFPTITAPNLPGEGRPEAPHPMAQQGLFEELAASVRQQWDVPQAQQGAYTPGSLGHGVAGERPPGGDPTGETPDPGPLGTQHEMPAGSDESGAPDLTQRRPFGSVDVSQREPSVVVEGPTPARIAPEAMIGPSPQVPAVHGEDPAETIFNAIRGHYRITIGGNLPLGEKAKFEIRGHKGSRINVAFLEVN